MVYFFNLERMFFVFGRSQWQFSKIYMNISRCLLLTYLILFVILLILIPEPYRGDDGFCDAVYPIFMYIIPLFGDIIICSSISTLFARRLLRLSIEFAALQRQISQTESTKDTKNVE
eukprot:363732_1